MHWRKNVNTYIYIMILTEDWKSVVWSDLMRTMATNEPRISDNSSPAHVGIPFDLA